MTFILIFLAFLLPSVKSPVISEQVRFQLSSLASQLSPVSNVQDTLYLNSENKLTSKRKNAESFKVVTKTDSGYVVEFLDKDQVLTQKTTYKDPELKVAHGSSVGYLGKTIGSVGTYADGKEEGLWKYYHWDGKVSGIINYKNGKKVSEEYFNPDGVKETDPKKTDQLPSFPGGQNAMGAYYGKVLRYPPNARERGVQGTVKIGFNISVSGKLEDIRVISGPHEELNNEALRVVRMMPRWTPAIQFNRPVKIAYVLPIFFQLGNQSN